MAELNSCSITANNKSSVAQYSAKHAKPANDEHGTKISVDLTRPCSRIISVLFNWKPPAPTRHRIMHSEKFGAMFFQPNETRKVNSPICAGLIHFTNHSLYEPNHRPHMKINTARSRSAFVCHSQQTWQQQECPAVWVHLPSKIFSDQQRNLFLVKIPDGYRFFQNQPATGYSSILDRVLLWPTVTQAMVPHSHYGLHRAWRHKFDNNDVSRFH